MKAQTITSTDAARSFSDLLNKVRYQNKTFIIIRGNEAVAEISPPKAGVSISDLSALLARLPKLNAKERDEFAKDMEEIRQQTKLDIDQWD